MKKIIVLVCILCTAMYFQTSAQTKVDKNKKSRYFKNHTEVDPGEGFDVGGFERNYNKRKTRQQVERKSKKEYYKVDVRSKDEVGKYQNPKKIRTIKTITTAPVKKKVVKERRARRPLFGNRREKTRKPIFGETKKGNVITNERVIYMSEKEKDYATTVVRKRYTSLDILADDLDISKYQRPVFKGICQECDADVDKIITNKNLSSLDKNYQLKQAYMLRDKRLRETLDSQQYKKWHRIKDEDEYLILTKDPELIDGVYK